ncbi:MAG TPA: ABC transporter substrate-binding protein [Burkholderiaceae bacterium]|nr:ABC transporter substrate-binding protein [Burkholderiaceae bacterium]
MGRVAWAILVAIAILLAGCNNNPLPDGAGASNTLFTAVSGSSPRHLDPTASYWSNETPYTYQIYEPPYGYHYLKRPFVLQGKTAVEVAQPTYLDHAGHKLPADAPAADIAESVYEVRIKPGILFQPHPAFATDAQGRHRYHSEIALKAGEIGDRRSPWEFRHQGTRELVAEDYVYAIKRHATTRITTPIFGIFSEYVLGLKEYGELIKAEDAKLRAGLDPAALDKPFLDFRQWPLIGATAPGKHLLRIRIKGKYPQWNYWMALTFMSPVPWEADAFYAQPGMAANGLSLDHWPVGTGPYMMAESVQDTRHVMKRNPNYRGEPYPCEGVEADRTNGLLADCGRKTPFIDTLVSVIEKEGVPLRAKFRQGYYDIPRIERTDDGLDFLVEMDDSEDVRRDYTERGFRLPKFADVTSWYLGFNMLDPVIGQGDTPERQAKNRRLRQAISIAIDWEEYSRIFPKSAGETAMGPLPDGVFGSRHGQPQGVNAVTHRVVDGKQVRRPIADARQLLAEAGYPDGRDAVTGRPLVLNYDYYSQPTPEVKSQLDWMVKQFAKIDVQLEIRATDNNQFQDKVRQGKHQIFWSGWLADYPDAENFLFLLYGPNAKSKSDGENTANYANPEYDRLFAQLKGVDDGPEKQALIDRMTAIVQQDAPWSFGYFPYSSGAFQSWVHNAKPAVLVRDMARYYRIDAAERVRRQTDWNRPVWWPMLIGVAALVAVVVLAVRSFRRRERLDARGAVL